MVNVIRFVFATIGVLIRWTVALALWLVGGSLLYLLGWMTARSNVAWQRAHWTLTALLAVSFLTYILAGCYVVRRYFR